MSNGTQFVEQQELTYREVAVVGVINRGGFSSDVKQALAQGHNRTVQVDEVFVQCVQSCNGWRHIADLGDKTVKQTEYSGAAEDIQAEVVG